MARTKYRTCNRSKLLDILLRLLPRCRSVCNITSKAQQRINQELCARAPSHAKPCLQVTTPTLTLTSKNSLFSCWCIVGYLKPSKCPTRNNPFGCRYVPPGSILKLQAHRRGHGNSRKLYTRRRENRTAPLMTMRRSMDSSSKILRGWPNGP